MEVASLIRVRPEQNEWRFYRIEVWPDGSTECRRTVRRGTSSLNAAPA
jgi:hypothetical protein